MAQKNSNMLGSWAFLIGIVLAVVLGYLGYMTGTWSLILILIGLIVGLLNVTNAETHSFMMSGAVLIIATSLGQSAFSGAPMVSGVLESLLVVLVPATVIVAIKNVFMLARN